MNSVIRFATPHGVTFRDGGAVVTLPSSGAVHRLNGPAARVVRHVVGGNVNPSLWTRDEQDALAVLCDLGVLEFSEHSLNRRTLIAGASALGITTLAMPSAVAAASGIGGGGGGGGEATPSITVVNNGYQGVDSQIDGTTVGWGVGTSDFLAFEVLGSAVSLQYMLVGGGGGGARLAGGGGGGGIVELGSALFPVGQYNVRVGSGGTAGTGVQPGTAGGTSKIQLLPSSTSWTAAGGGGGSAQGGNGGSSARPGGTGSGSSSASEGGGGGGGYAGAGSSGDGGNGGGGYGGNGGQGTVISGFFSYNFGAGGGGGGGGYFSGGNGDESTGGAGGGSVEGSGGNASDNSGGGGGGGGELAGNAGRGGRGFVAIKATPGVAVTEV